MTETTIKDIITFLEQLQQVDLKGDVDNHPNITDKQKILVKDYLATIQKQEFQKVIVYLKNLQTQPAKNKLEKYLRYLNSKLYTQLLKCRLLEQPKITLHKPSRVKG